MPLPNPDGGPWMARKPNIIQILADDMGFADLGCTGSGIRTPISTRWRRAARC